MEALAFSETRLIENDPNKEFWKGKEKSKGAIYAMRMKRK